MVTSSRAHFHREFKFKFKLHGKMLNWIIYRGVRGKCVGFAVCGARIQFNFNWIRGIDDELKACRVCVCAFVQRRWVVQRNVKCVALLDGYDELAVQRSFWCRIKSRHRQPSTTYHWNAWLPCPCGVRCCCSTRAPFDWRLNGFVFYMRRNVRALVPHYACLRCQKLCCRRADVGCWLARWATDLHDWKLQNFHAFCAITRMSASSALSWTKFRFLVSSKRPGFGVYSPHVELYLRLCILWTLNSTSPPITMCIQSMFGIQKIRGIAVAYSMDDEYRRTEPAVARFIEMFDNIEFGWFESSFIAPAMNGCWTENECSRTARHLPSW